jgi:uncharacterized circularly permuted ATP-grasp superfamily protein
MAGGRPVPLSRPVAEAIEAYHALVSAADPRAQAAWLGEAFQREGILFDGRPMATFLRPHLVTRAQWDDLRGAGLRLLQLAAAVARRAFDGDAARLCDWLGTPAEQRPWVVHDPGLPDVVLSRLDGFLTPDGPRFIEINSDAPAGFGYGDRMAAVFRALPVFSAFAARRAVSYVPSAPAVVAAVLRAAARGPAPAVAIVDWNDVKTRPDQEILREAFEAAGIKCLLADPRDFELAGGRLVAAGQPVDVVYRRALLAELAPRADEVRPFLAGYAEGRAVFVNSFRCHLSEDKAFLGLLTDEAFSTLLTGEDEELVRRVVPWTRRVEERHTVKDGRPIDLVPWIRGHRTELVLKPAHDYGGRSVFVGEEATAGEWDAALQEALSRPWVVQERVPIPREPFPVTDEDGLRFEELHLNANPFYVAGEEAGGVTRVSRRAVINVSAGGGSVPTFVLE